MPIDRRRALAKKAYLCQRCGHGLHMHQESAEWRLLHPRRQDTSRCRERGCSCEQAVGTVPYNPLKVHATMPAPYDPGEWRSDVEWRISYLEEAKRHLRADPHHGSIGVQAGAIEWALKQLSKLQDDLWHIAERQYAERQEQQRFEEESNDQTS